MCNTYWKLCIPFFFFCFCEESLSSGKGIYSFLYYSNFSYLYRYKSQSESFKRVMFRLNRNAYKCGLFSYIFMWICSHINLVFYCIWEQKFKWIVELSLKNKTEEIGFSVSVLPFTPLQKGELKDCSKTQNVSILK